MRIKAVWPYFKSKMFNLSFFYFFFFTFVILQNHLWLYSCVSVSTEHPVLRHALVLRAFDHGVDQRVCDADESAAASQLLRPAASLCRSPRPLAEAGARLVQQRAPAPVSGTTLCPLVMFTCHGNNGGVDVLQMVRKHNLAAGRVGPAQPMSI